MVQAPSWMPNTAKAVTLGGEPGWFISARSIQEAQQMMPEVHYADGGKGAKRVSKGFDLSKLVKMDNPGLDATMPAYTGVVKNVPALMTGYGFISCDEIQAQYPGKDVFV